MIKTPNQVYMQNLSQISGPVCPQLFDLASFLWTIAFDKAEPTLEQGNFIKSLGSGKIVRYIHYRELVIDIFEFNQKGQNYENYLSYFKFSLLKLMFVFSPHFIVVRKTLF